MIGVIKDKLPWPMIRAHACTIAVALSVNSTVKIPQDAFRYGGLPYLLVFTFFSIVVAMPVALLQLCTGQLSQQDAVGTWRAVPFFKGVGYLKLLTSFIGSVYTTIFTAIAAMYFLYTLRSSIPFWECREWFMTSEGIENKFNASTCLHETFLSPVTKNPDYYAVVAIVIIIIWGASTLLVYSPVRSMKRTYYFLGPCILLLAVTILSAVGDINYLRQIENTDDWKKIMEPHIWHSAMIQSLMSAQIGTGYLISAAGTIYSSANVQWTAVSFVITNVVVGWLSVIFWYSIGRNYEEDTSIFTVIIVAYKATEINGLNDVWPLLIYATLLTSGLIGMVTFLFPIYDRLRRMAGDTWRRTSVAVSLIGVAAALSVLAGRQTVVAILIDLVVPILIAFTTLVEVIALVFIYGWKSLLDDIQFLTGDRLIRYWHIAWCGNALVILPFFVWWILTIFWLPLDWSIQSWELWAVTTFGIVVLVLVIFAVLSVHRQVQYDMISKIKSSFRPSIHWGPRDPITHYYWLARREENQINNSAGEVSPRYSGWQLGQISGAPSFIRNTSGIDKTVYNDWLDIKPDIKRRANSDDWLYTRFREKYKEAANYFGFEVRQRSRSLDWLSGVLCPNKNDNMPPVDNNKRSNLGITFNTLTQCNVNRERVPTSQEWEGIHKAEQLKKKQVIDRDSVENNNNNEGMEDKTIYRSQEGLTTF